MTIYRECLLFQFFSSGMFMRISILTKVQNERITQEKSHILLKNVFFFKFVFLDEDHLHASCLFYIQTV